MAPLGGSTRFLAFVLGFMAVGCRQVLAIHHRELAVDVDAGADGDTDDGGADDAPTEAQPTAGKCGSLLYPSESCATCMDDACCGVAQTCRDDAQCGASAHCYLACAADDSDCRGRCQAFYGQPDPLLEVLACRARNCGEACGEPCGDLNNGVSTCDTCVASSCCAAARACANDADCLRLQVCRSNCLSGSTACPTDCQTRFSGSATKYSAWTQCTQNTCANACKLGTSWACLDHPVPWPKPSKFDDISFRFTAVDLRTEKPFSKVQVRACARLDVECTDPLDTQIADDTGTVTLRVHPGVVGFDGYLEFTKGALGGDGGEIYPALWFPVPPYIQGGDKGKSQFVSKSDFVALELITGITDDPTRGHLALNARDCSFTPAGGVAFSADKADSASRTFYFINGNPDTSAKATDSQTAIGGIVNLKAGLVLVTGKLVEQQMRTIGEITFIVRPGTMTAAFFQPTP
jgi:hypothetical protein